MTTAFGEGFTDLFKAFDDLSTKKVETAEISGQPSKEERLMQKLMTFFSFEFNRNQMLPIIYGESPISLRVLDWFVTNFAKQYAIMYGIQKSGELRHFSVHANYRSKLKTHTKKRFDPFCRRKIL